MWKEKGAVNGAPVYNVRDGVVVKLVTKEDGDDGGVRVRIQDKAGYQYAYYHLQTGSNSHLQINQFIDSGAVLGRVGNTGGSRGPHLHFEVHGRNYNEIINPYKLFPQLKQIQKQ